MRNTKRFASLAAIALLGLVAAACGSDSKSSGATGGTTAPAATTASGATSAPQATTAAGATTVAGGTTGTPSGTAPKVGLVFDIGGRGDQSFNDSAAAGIERAQKELGITFTEASPNSDGSNRKELLDLAAQSSDIVIAVGFLFEPDAATVGTANPTKTFGVVDSAMVDAKTGKPYSPNIAGLVFSEEQGSFLVGAAAALKSKTGQVGFIGGVKGVGGLIEKFEAGYIAGAKAAKPDIKVISKYITEAPNFDGFNAPDQARDIATTMYDGGADIIYSAAGGSGAGVFQAAKATSESGGSKVWAIGVDSDQYNTADPTVKDYILTSMIKHVDVAVFEIVKAAMDGNVKGGPTRYDLSVNGVGYATSGGFIDDIKDKLEAYKADIISGKIVVPTDPTKA
ncbi:MAG TPA: BMP family ABC transporter substrate-binding protein [Ilumatobacteraceae bacterium]|jgi:basic membrane protein A